MQAEIDDSELRFQFGLKSLMIATTSLGVYIAGTIASVQWITEVGMGWFGLGAVVLGMLGFGLMVASIALGQSRRLWNVAVLGFALLYAAANVGIFILMITVDRFAIFSIPYWGAFILVLPCLMMMLIMLFGAYVRVGWLTNLGYTIWIGAVGFAHMWVIAVCSASV